MAKDNTLQTLTEGSGVSARQLAGGVIGGDVERPYAASYRRYNLEKRRAYMRAYMREYMRKRRGG